MAGRQMSALAHLGANNNPSKQKPTLSRHQNAISATAEGEPYPATSSLSRTSKAVGERMAERRQKPKPSSLTADSSGTLHDTGDMIIDETLPFDSDPLPNEPAQPPTPASSTPPINSSISDLPINPADMPSISSSSFDTPINSFPVSNSPTRSSAIQTVQSYLTNQAQTIQSHLTAILPGLIQGEVRMQCSRLAQEIGTQISSIREEVIRPTGDQDDLMLPSCEEGENEGSRGRGKRSDKGKGKQVRSAPENDSEPDDSGTDGSDNDDEGISKGHRKRKYTRQIRALREPLRTFLIQKGVVVKEEHGLPVLPLPPCAPAIHVKQFKGKHSRYGPDASNIQYNWRSPLAKCPWNRQATLLLALEYLELYRDGKIKLKHRILPYDPKADLKTIQKTIRLRIARTQIYWKDQNYLPNNSDDDDDHDGTTTIPRTREERAEKKVTLTRHRMRGLKLLRTREENIKKYLNGNLQEALLNMLRRLHSAGMNHDITDSESSDRVLQPCRHWWLSDDIITILQELEALGKRAKASRLVSRKGNRPLPRMKNIKVVYDSTITTGLPKNWYRHEWYENLCPFEQGDLSCADPETLPSIHDIQAAIQYLSARS